MSSSNPHEGQARADYIRRGAVGERKKRGRRTNDSLQENTQDFRE